MTNEYVELVDSLNEQLYEKCEDTIYGFHYTYTGLSHIIYFSDIVLWHSEWDDREFFEDINDYEPLEGFVKKEFNKLLEDLQKLKF